MLFPYGKAAASRWKQKVILLTKSTDPNTHDMMTVLDEEEFVASAVVYPSSVEEVQKIVLWANEHVIPIFPISMGRNCE